MSFDVSNWRATLEVSVSDGLSCPYFYMEVSGILDVVFEIRNCVSSFQVLMSHYERIGFRMLWGLVSHLSAWSSGGTRFGSRFVSGENTIGRGGVHGVGDLIEMIVLIGTRGDEGDSPVIATRMVRWSRAVVPGVNWTNYANTERKGVWASNYAVELSAVTGQGFQLDVLFCPTRSRQAF